MRSGKPWSTARFIVKAVGEVTLCLEAMDVEDFLKIGSIIENAGGTVLM
ncbi:MAG: hypothetical protein ACLTBV_26785 [Enterocloster bolteae]